MEPLIAMIVLIVFFAIAVYGAFWICDKAGFPQPVRWLVGLIFLIALLYYVSGHGAQFGFNR